MHIRVGIAAVEINQSEILDAYITPYNLNSQDFYLKELYAHPTKKKTLKADLKQYVEEELVSFCNQNNLKYLLVTDAEYFKLLADTNKADQNIGYVMDSKYLPRTKVLYIPNYKRIFYDPEKITTAISRAIEALQAHMGGRYTPPGDSILKTALYPSDPEDIFKLLESLLDLPEIACDVETFSLKHTTSGIGTISFAWNQEEGAAFCVDLGNSTRNSRQIRSDLVWFFENYKGRILWHSASFDLTILIYQLFMTDILDTEGLLNGLEVMGNWECTKLISYLALNSCAGNDLSLKTLAQPFAGNYGLGGEIKDITKIPVEQLLEYNLIDTASTFYVRNKYWPIMVRDEQYEFYQEIFRPALTDIIQMQLTGIPVNIPNVIEAKNTLQADEVNSLRRINSNPYVRTFIQVLNHQWVIDKNNTLKKKRVTITDAKEEFNPGSSQQLQRLLFEELKLPVLAKTDSGLPSTEGDVLKALKNHTTDKDILDLLDALMDFKAVNIILTTFIPAFLRAVKGPDGWYYLFGNFNLGGTVSGRLSSSDPNLQNLPASGSRYAKIIKRCFSAPPGWLFVGLDFDSLEDKISGLTTKDPNKLKVYTDGFDGHSLRAFAYFGDQMEGIDPDSVVSINSIAQKYPKLRYDSKAPTFALTYQGTWWTLVKNCGFTNAFAKSVETKYLEMYSVSIDWVNAKLDEAMKTGYVVVAFGLRVRTPLLKQVIRNTSKTPPSAEAEGRTAGNAMGQSWCLLNSRAASEFMAKVRTSKYRLDIRPSIQIHDAQYYIIRDNIETVMYTNEHLVQAVKWQDHPEIYHDQVKLGGKLSFFFPTWAEEYSIPNHATEEEIIGIVAGIMEKIKDET